jgi:hypothetical protein
MLFMASQMLDYYKTSVARGTVWDESTRLRVPGVGMFEASREELDEHGGEGFSQGNARWGAAGSINGLHKRSENLEHLLAEASRVPIQTFGHAAGFAGDMSEAAQAPAVLALDPGRELFDGFWFRRSRASFRSANSFDDNPRNDSMGSLPR